MPEELRPDGELCARSYRKTVQPLGLLEINLDRKYLRVLKPLEGVAAKSASWGATSVAEAWVELKHKCLQ